MPTSDPPARPGLTAAEFLAAFNGYTALPLGEDSHELRDLERAILRYLPAVALLAKQLADGELSGEPLQRLFKPLYENIERVEDEVKPLERQLWHARAAAGLPARNYHAESPGTSAALALLGVARRVIKVVLDEIYTTVFDYDEDPPHEYDVLTWGMTADCAPREVQDRLRLSRPAAVAPRNADGADAAGRRWRGHVGAAGVASGTGRIRRDGSRERRLRACGPAPRLPGDSLGAGRRGRAEAAQRSKGKDKVKRPKEEPVIEPLPAERPHPVRIVQLDGDPPLRTIAVNANSSPLVVPDALPTVYYHGERSYSLDGKSPTVVSNEQHQVLKEFLDKDHALTTDALKNAVGNVSNVLSKLSKRFGAAVRLPGPNKGDGYFIRVRTAK